VGLTGGSSVTRLLALVSIGALALWAQPAWAQGNKSTAPKVTAIDPAEGVAGTNVLLTGVNFTEKREDIEVLAGGTKCLILELAVDKIRFFIPTTPPPSPGNLRIEVKIKGSETCSTNFKIADPKNKKEEEARREAERKKYEGGSTYEDPYKLTDKLLSITKFEINGGSNPTVVIEGDNTLPRDFFITVSFGIIGQQDERQIGTHKITLKGATWKTTFGAPPVENWTGKTLLAGKYYAYIQFEMAKQNSINMRAAGWPDKLSKEEREVRQLIWKKEIKDFGTEADVKKQVEEIRGHYVELCRSTTDCLEVLERAYASAGKSYFKKAGGGSIDETEWETWVKDRKIGLSEDDLKKIKADTRFVKSAYFNAEAWQKWTEEDFFKKLGDAYKKHDDIKKKYITARDQRVEVEGDYLLTIVVKLAQLYTSEIYTRNKLEVPATLRAPKEFTGGLESVAVSRGHFEGHRKLLLERLGLSSFEPGKKDDKK
jgi:hypothetical protein